MNDRPYLRLLAERAGIVSSYYDLSGVERVTTDETRQRLLRGMGMEVESEAEAEAELARWDTQDPSVRGNGVCVIQGEYEEAVWVTRYADGVHGPSDHVHVVLMGEDGQERTVRGIVTAKEGHAQVALELPPELEHGYYRVMLDQQKMPGADQGEQMLVYAPPVCCRPTDIGWQAGTFGVWVNAYAARSRRNWGMGDCSDIGWLLSKVVERGGSFVGVNPLHALDAEGVNVSPYAPITRLFDHVVYIDVEQVCELEECPKAREWLQSAEAQMELARLRSSAQIDYPAVLAIKLKVLRQLYDVFCEQHLHRGTERAVRFLCFREKQGTLLRDYATFAAMAAVRGDYRTSHWPVAWRHVDSPEVATFRAEHQEEVDFHCYMQFELDRQWQQAVGGSRGRTVGLYKDLALGAAGEGFDAWRFPELFARDVEIGAPPDPYSAKGQMWGIPPIIPHRLAASGYAYWIAVLRSAMRHARMLRIDHVMGLFRQFWVPKGMQADCGAYVRYPWRALLAILALESRRNGVVMVGEDLGTVPAEVPREMERRRILSTRVMWFERDDHAFRPAESYPSNALVTTTTHDLAPLAGLLTGRDLTIRENLGLFDSMAAAEASRDERSRVRSAMYRRLGDMGLLSNGAGDSDGEAVLRAVYAFLRRTPAALISVSLDDMGGETDPVNLPGIGPEVFPSWSRRMRRTLEAILADPLFTDVMRLLRREPSETEALD